jgi:hypothetical protein
VALLTDLVGLPGLTILGLLAFGGIFVVKPRRIVAVLSDTFAFGNGEGSGARRKMLVARLAGVALIGYAVYLGASTLQLAQSLNHYQPAPQRLSQCDAPISDKSACPSERPKR